MKLNTNAILSLIGGILVLVGLFIPAIYGIVSSGINSNGHISIIEMSDGYLFLIAAVLALIFTFIKNLEKWAWIFGGLIGLLGILDLYNIVKNINGLYAQAPMYRDFISFGPGMFILLVGGVLILISRLFLTKTLIKETENE